MPVNVRATLAIIATSIAIVKADVKKGEKVFNAYMMMSPFVLNCWLVIGWSARLFSFCFSVFNRNEWGRYLIALCLHYKRKKERCQVLF